MTKSDEPLVSLRRLVAGAQGLQAAFLLFRFTSEKRFTPERSAPIFEPIWESQDWAGDLPPFVGPLRMRVLPDWTTLYRTRFPGHQGVKFEET